MMVGRGLHSDQDYDCGCDQLRSWGQEGVQLWKNIAWSSEAISGIPKTQNNAGETELLGRLVNWRLSTTQGVRVVRSIA
jgi:hypothetical protein